MGGEEMFLRRAAEDDGVGVVLCANLLTSGKLRSQQQCIITPGVFSILADHRNSLFGP